MTYLQKSYLSAGFTVFALLVSGCADASSSDTPPVTAKPTTQVIAEAETRVGNWIIRPESSHIQFSALQEGVDFTGAFGKFSGVIQFDPNAPEDGAVRIEIPLRSVDAGSKDRNSTLPGKIWFSTKKFPQAVFTSNDIAYAGDGFLAKGSLELKGMSIPVDLPFSLSIDGNHAVMRGETLIDRTDWNVGSAPWDTDEWISRSVKINVKITADAKE